MKLDFRNLVEASFARVEKAGDRLGFSFLNSDDSRDNLTFDQFDQKARALAALLQARGLEKERVVILLPPGLDYVVAFWACIYANAIAVPAYPPDPTQLERTLPRLGAILKDSGAKAILTSSGIRELAQSIVESFLNLTNVAWLAVEEALDPREWKTPKIGRDDLALLQYTSGSTGDPRGVMLSHGNILINMHMSVTAFEVDDTMRGVLWLPPYHDMGLMVGVVDPVVHGYLGFLMSPLDFLSRPIRWLEIMSEGRLEGSGGPNFAYELCARRVTEEQKSRLDLSNWQLAFCGAEPIRAATLRRFADVFAPCGFKMRAFYTAYGLAEGTVMVAGGSRKDPPVIRAFSEEALSRGAVELDPTPRGKELVSSGHAAEDLTLEIVDPETRLRVAPGRVGEIWVRAASVGKGYWGREAESAEIFRAKLADGSAGEHLRTGDLGFILDGELFIVGRIKDIIIVAGVNYYPQDVEVVVDDAHKLVRPGCVAAFSLEQPEGEVLAVVAEAKDASTEELREAAEAIRFKVSTHNGLSPGRVVLIAKHQLPKTSSGKVRRRATREAFLAGSLTVLGSFDWTNEAVLRPRQPKMREDLLALDPEARKKEIEKLVFDGIGRVASGGGAKHDLNTRITQLGIASVDVVDMLATLEEDLGVVILADRTLEQATVGDVVLLISSALAGEPPPSHLLDSAQRGPQAGSKRE